MGGTVFTEILNLDASGDTDDISVVNSKGFSLHLEYAANVGLDGTFTIMARNADTLTAQPITGTTVAADPAGDSVLIDVKVSNVALIFLRWTRAAGAAGTDSSVSWTRKSA